MSLLHWACKLGYFEIALLLVIKGAIIDYQDIVINRNFKFIVKCIKITIIELFKKYFIEFY